MKPLTVLQVYLLVHYRLLTYFKRYLHLSAWFYPRSQPPTMKRSRLACAQVGELRTNAEYDPCHRRFPAFCTLTNVPFDHACLLAKAKTLHQQYGRHRSLTSSVARLASTPVNKGKSSHPTLRDPKQHEPSSDIPNKRETLLIDDIQNGKSTRKRAEDDLSAATPPCVDT